MGVSGWYVYLRISHLIFPQDYNQIASKKKNNKYLRLEVGNYESKGSQNYL